MESKQVGTIAVLRECKNKWERRCSITPTEVAELVKLNIKVIVQPSSTRCFTEDEFTDAGAVIQEDVTEASVIFGVKEVPIGNLLANKTYFFFSHTIKAQPYNMPLLDQLLARNIRMVDFERIQTKPEEGKMQERLVAFGRYAGIAGAFDFIRGIGEYLLEKKYQTPFVFLGSTYMYQDYDAMCNAVGQIAKNIERAGLPKQLSPLVIGVTGTGRCASGSLEVLEILPHVKVAPSDLRAFLADPVNKANNKRVVLVQFTSKDVAVKIDGTPFEKAEYYSNPERFQGCFEDYLDLVHFVVNDIYWEEKYPRLISNEGLKKAVEAGKCALMGVTDISADECGSMQFTSRFTSIEEPFLLYNPVTMSFKEKIAQMAEHDILFTSVDHLPAEMPVEASRHFGSKLLPFVEAVVKSDFTKPFAEQQDLPLEIYNAIITANGELTPNFKYIEALRALNPILEDNCSSHALQGFTLQLSGHLFDKQIINKVLDLAEQTEINFRVVSWNVGQTLNDNTAVVMQGLGMNDELLAETEDKIRDFCKKEDVKCVKVKGPDFEKPVNTASLYISDDD